MNKRVFSLPINPKLSEEFVTNTFLPFLKEYREYILDLYFTCRIPPFDQDAMGDTFLSPEALVESACYISNQSDIPLSATFNNIWVRPDQKNLDLWIKEFAPIYNAGVRVVTLPHTSWVSTGQIRSAFPDLFIKNTILREVTKPNEIVQLAEAGFNYINLDRDLMRDRDQLLRIQKAKDYCAYLGKPVMLSMLVNETCWGGCPIMPEHYQYNSTRTQEDPIFFASPISRVSCSTWDVEHPESDLKAANLPPWREDWQEMLDLGIDTFKLHGRESMMRLQESMDLIKRWADKDEYMFPEYKKYQKQLKMKNSPLKKWREKIKTCKFDCWDCNYCDSVVQSRMKKNDRHFDDDIKLVLESIDKAARRESNFIEEGYKYEGLSSNIVRHFLNNLLSKPDAIYMELGVHAGSTFYAATMNRDVESFAIDNYSEKEISPFRDEVEVEGYQDPKKTFWAGLQEKQYFCAKSIQDLTPRDIHKQPNVIFYDADHDPQAQYDNLTFLIPALADKFILVVDDANFMGVVQSSEFWIKEHKLNLLFERKILTKVPEDPNGWWNGIHVMVLQK